MLYIDLKRDNSVSIVKQLYRYIRECIFNGTLKENQKLPSSRELAKDLNVSRNSIIEAYEQLIAEGYLYTKQSSGTYVTKGIIYEDDLKSNYFKEKNKKTNSKSEAMINFRTGIPDLSSVPIKKWGQIYKNITLSAREENIDYQDPAGVYELRYELAKYLRRVRGVNATADNIIITSGAAQSFSLLSQLVQQNEYALVENPLSLGLLNTIRNKKVKIKSIPVDDYGINTSLLPKSPPKLIFTTPSHQFPTGVVLPIKRRIEITKYARLHNAFIVEDDYDSEFRFKGIPIQSMQALDTEHVIYVGTFSKIFMPSLRMGYMVLPNCLYKKMKKAKYIDDIHSPILEQLTMAEFIKEGHLDLHIKKMKKVYLKKRNVLIKALNKVFRDKVIVSGIESGMHLIAFFQGLDFSEDLMRKIEEKNIKITPLKKYYISSKNQNMQHNNALIFGYGNMKIELIEKAVEELNKAIYGEE